MRLYTTDHGIAREDTPGTLSILDVPYRDIGELLRAAGIDRARNAGVRGSVALAEATLHAPITRPGKILIVGLNYPSHADEALEAFAAMGRTDITMPDEPNMQIVAGSAVAGPSDDIRLPPAAPSHVDYEGELAVVIGSESTCVAAESAWRNVAGLTVGNDLGARDIQRRAMSGDPVASIGVAKSFDTFKPLGPCLVTADEFINDRGGDAVRTAPIDLALTTRVNGELRQSDRTGNLIYSVAELVSHLSEFQTLHAGDVILTGTPRGAGVFTNRFLQPGDEVSIAIERIGTITNRVVAG